jgi:hypothetical protein
VKQEQERAQCGLGVLAPEADNRPARRCIVNLPDDVLLEGPKLDRLADVAPFWDLAVGFDPLMLRLARFSPPFAKA